MLLNALWGLIINPGSQRVFKVEKHDCILVTRMPGHNYCTWACISKKWRGIGEAGPSSQAGSLVSFLIGMASRPISCSFSPLKSSVFRKETICALWCGSEKKKATPHFEMLCRTASRSISLEERARRLSYGLNERSLSNTWRISDSGGILSFKKNTKANNGKCRDEGNNFPTEGNLYFEDMPEAGDSKSSTKAKHPLPVWRLAFPGARSRPHSGSFLIFYTEEVSAS